MRTVWVLSIYFLATCHCQSGLTDPDLNIASARVSVSSDINFGPSTGGDTAEQRHYQPGFGINNYNLESQNEPYHLEYEYHNYDKMTKFLRATSAKYPTLTALYSIGKSVQGMQDRAFV